MKIIDKKTIHSTENGDFTILLEDWSEDYPTVHNYADQLAAYPVAKESVTPHGAHTRVAENRSDWVCTFQAKKKQEKQCRRWKAVRSLSRILCSVSTRCRDFPEHKS